MHARAFAAGTGLPAALLSAVLLFLYTMSVALVPVRADNDTWWHVKTGLYISEHGLPEHDIFSFTAADYEWHNHETLAQLAMAAVWRAGEQTGLGGWRAVILAKSLTLAACYMVLWFLAGRISRNWWIALLVAVIAVGVGRRTFYPRPPVVSNLMLALLLLLVVGAREGWWRRRWLAVIPAYFALWANTHGAWLAGGVTLAAFAGADTLDEVRRRIPKISDRLSCLPRIPNPLPVWAWAALGVTTILGTLANPYGYKLYELPARVLGDSELVQAIGELQPPNLLFTYDFPMAAGLLLVAAIVALRRRRTGFLRVGEFLIYAFFLWQAAMHVRHLLLFSVVLVPLTARALGHAFGTIPLQSGTESEARTLSPVLPRTGVAALVLALLWGGMILRNWPEAESYPSRNEGYFLNPRGYAAERFPTRLVDFIEEVRPPGRMFNENHYAGYLIWRLAPEEYRVFSDSRFDIFGGTIWRQEAIVAAGFEGDEERGIPSWQDILDQWDVNWAIVRADTGLEEAMLEEGGWAKVADWSAVSRTSTFQIWVQDTEENAAFIEKARNAFRASTGATPW